MNTEYGCNDLIWKETSETLVKTAHLNCRVQTQMGGENTKAVSVETVNLEVRQ